MAQGWTWACVAGIRRMANFIHRQYPKRSPAADYPGVGNKPKPAGLRWRKYRTVELAGYAAIYKPERVRIGAHVSGNKCDTSTRYGEPISDRWSRQMAGRYFTWKGFPFERINEFANSRGRIQCLQPRELRQ